jgi:hypothetical protein
MTDGQVWVRFEREARRLADECFQRGEHVDTVKLAHQVVLSIVGVHYLVEYQVLLEDFIRTYAAKHPQGPN